MVPIQLERLVLVEGVVGLWLCRRSIELFAQADRTDLVELAEPRESNPHELIPLESVQLFTIDSDSQGAEIVEVVSTGFVGHQHKAAKSIAMRLKPGCLPLKPIVPGLLLEPLTLSWRHLGALLFQPSGMALLDGLIERITLLRA